METSRLAKHLNHSYGAPAVPQNVTPKTPELFFPAVGSFVLLAKSLCSIARNGYSFGRMLTKERRLLLGPQVKLSLVNGKRLRHPV